MLVRLILYNIIIGKLALARTNGAEGPDKQMYNTISTSGTA